MNKLRIFSVIFILLSLSSCKNAVDEVESVKAKGNARKDSFSVQSVPEKTYKDPTLPPTADYSGDHIVKYSNGITNMRGFFRFGKKHGRWASFFPSGQLQSETQFDNGIRTGKACVWYTNGKVMYEGEYKNDVKTGEWKSYDTSGVLIDTKKY